MSSKKLCMVFTIISVWNLTVFACLSAAEPSKTLDPYNFKDGQVMFFDHPDWFKWSTFDLRQDLKEAVKAGKFGLMLYYSTNGCSYCKVFQETTLKDPKTVSRLQRHFDVIGLEMFSDEELTDLQGKTYRIKAFSKASKIVVTPTIVFYDRSGKEAMRLTGYYPKDRFSTALTYLLDGHDKKESLRSFLDRQHNRPGSGDANKMIVDSLFDRAPYYFDRRAAASDRPLLVMFDKGGCASCKRFHDEVLGVTKVRRLISHFEAVQLDLEDRKSLIVTPEGRSMTAAQWADELKLQYIPAIVMFDEAGKERSRIDFEIKDGRTYAELQFVLEKGYEKYWGYQPWRREKRRLESLAK